MVWITLDIGRDFVQPAANLLEHGRLVFRQRFDRRLADHLHHLVAAGLELLEQFRRRFRGAMLEVVHQDDALAVLGELGHDRFDDLLRLVNLEIERVHVGGEDADIARAEIGDHLRRMPQRREAEEWRDRRVAERDAHRGDTFFDFCFGFVSRQLRQILVRPGVGADGVAGLDHFLQDIGTIAGVFADREEQRLGALVAQRLEHTLGIARPRTVVESQHDFFFAQEVVGLEVLEAETGAAGGVDLNHALDAEAVRIVAFGLCDGWRGGGGGRCGGRRSSRGLGGLCPDGSARRRHRNRKSNG